MKVIVLCACLLAAAYGKVPIHGAYNYHENIGISEANRIKQAESALDFDGSRIVGGNPSSLGANPHLGGLVISLTSGMTSVCGSSLLSNTKAVTAAHCWYDGKNQAWQFVVVLGSLTLFTGGSRIASSNVQMHENWNWNNAHNDIAIIHLSWIGFNNNIQPIQPASGSNNYVGTWAMAAGYGKSADAQQGVPINTVQRQVSLRVITNAECINTFGPLPIIASTLCTSGEGGSSTCGGDSGGPLYIGSGNNRLLIGVTSFGTGKCQVGQPAGFARVSSFHSWISARM